jgi:RecJ-like exonuclease
MVCQVCGNKSGFYPLCSECNELKKQGKITKCNNCGIWKEGDMPLCKECWLKEKKETQKKSGNYQATQSENEENSFRQKFKATIRAEDGHMVRSRAEKMIDDWLYHKGIVHSYERRVPIEEEVFCDFFIPIGQKVWIEFWGLEEERYLERKRIKKSFYEKHDKNLIELADKDIENLDDIMPIKLRPFLPPSFSFD